jgi:hypothetical protein
MGIDDLIGFDENWGIDSLGNATEVDEFREEKSNAGFEAQDLKALKLNK